MRQNSFICKFLLIVYTSCLVHLQGAGKQLSYQHNAGFAHEIPNIVILLVDDLGIGDVGCFGNTTINTPNIDRLASEGVKLEHNLAPESLCTPSRAAFLTGRYAIRSGFGSDKGDVRVFTQTAIQGGLPANEVTFAKILQQNGYRTGYIGKWHLGISCNTSTDFCHHPNNHGFDHFYGLPLTNQRECGKDWGAPFNDVDLKIRVIMASLFVSIPVIYSLLKKKMLLSVAIFIILNLGICYFYVPPIIKAMTRHRLGCILMRDTKVVEQPVILENLTHRFTTDAVNFIQENRQRPFLLFMSFVKVHTALFTMDHFKNKSKHGRYGDNVEEMDWAVGKIIDEIDKLALKDKTFVYFSSDHGPHLEEISRNGEVCGGYQGIFKGGKTTSWEGGIRVPTIARWPGNIMPGTRLETPTSGLDIFPTILKIANASLPKNTILDGECITGLLTGQNSNSNHSRFIFHYCAKTLQAVTYVDAKRSKIWKIHFVTPNWSPGTEMCLDNGLCGCYGEEVTVRDPPLMYELNSDPTESSPISLHDDAMKTVLKETFREMKKHKSSVVEVPNQLKLSTFLPWMQLCCNPPFCFCQEEFPLDLIPI